jgi:hypothetical protein
MDKPLDELYFEWLCDQVGEDRTREPERSYWRILGKLFSTEFIWMIPNDDNRANDGIALRSMFIDQADIEVLDRHWMELPCSMLEMIIALVRRLSFEAEGEPRLWFWRLVENLNLEQYNDAVSFPEQLIDHILADVIYRTYKPNGRGGLFPLRSRRCPDQRNVELFYQMQAYVLERA